MNIKMSDLRVAVIAFNGISPFHLSIPHIVFGEDKRIEQNQPWFTVQTCSIDEMIIQTNAGYHIQCHFGYEEIMLADIIIIPSWHDVHSKPSDKLLKTLCDKYKQGAVIVGLCLGAFVLAYSGLLNHKKATTHWAWLQDFQSYFPEINLNGKAIYVDEDQLLTSAGVSAGLDCCLHLVRKYYGHDISNRIAKRLVIPPHREGNQTQFIDQPIAKTTSDIRLSNLLESIRENLTEDYSIDELANQLCISRSTFTRLFKKNTGQSFNDWLTRERISLAQIFLETTSQSIESIALKCGFNSSISLRKHFNHLLGISPSTYRHNFQTIRKK